MASLLSRLLVADTQIQAADLGDLFVTFELLLHFASDYLSL